MRSLYARAILTIATAVGLVGGCGGSTAPAVIAVTLSPATFSMQAGQSQSFTATVANDRASRGVTWAVSGSGCTGGACGTLSAPSSASGVAVKYTAPATTPTPGTITLTATSVADTTKTAAATITLAADPAIAVSVSPTTATVATGLTQAFTATVVNDAQAKGVTWALSQPGTTCAALVCGTLSATSGSPVTYTAPMSVPAPAGLTLTATSVADATKVATAAITVGDPAGPVSVTITPKRGGLVVGQTLNFTATVANDVAARGVTWIASSGTVTPQTAAIATFTAPTSPGVVTVTATSKVDATKTASVTIGVTDLAGVTTYHNDLSRDGANVQEYALNTTNVATATFGKLFSCTVDGAVAAQPLWVPNVNIGGGTHNVIVVATQRDSLYLFDADVNNCNTPYWQKQLIPTGETYGSFADVGTSDIYKDLGITGTPVIDAASNTIYLVTKTKNTGTTTYHHRLHALSLITGAEATNSPVEVTATVTGNCEGGTTISFNPLRQNQRPGLAFNPSNHTLYVGFASHGDVDMYHGWVMAYDTSNLTAAPGVFNTTPNTVAGQGFCQGGIWMSGGAPAIDSANNDVYLSTGNGAFDGMQDFGDSYLRLSPTLSAVMDYFTPFNQSTLAPGDLDVGSSGATLLIDQTGGPKPHLLIGGSKSSVFYVLDRDNLGKFNSASGATGDPAVVQEFGLSGASFSTPGFWNNTAYYFGSLLPTTNLIPGQSFAFDPTTGKFNPTPTQQTPSLFGFAGATPSVSASSATTDGIVWALDAGAFGTGDAVRAAGPVILHAFDASNLSKELWNSSQAAGARDTAGFAVKFTVPTVANGKVYVGTRGSDDTIGGGTTFGEIDVYGLLPN